MPRVIEEREGILVLDKPSGLIVHGDGRTSEPSVAKWLLQHYPSLKDVGEPWVSPQGEVVPRPGIVHRLDRQTSGVLIIAKTQNTWDFLRGEFQARRVKKKYVACVYGNLENEEGTIIAEIMRSKEPPRRWYAARCARDDKRAAITTWHVLKKLDAASLIQASPLTGRTHQIRVHFAFIGHPIVADPLYAKDHEPMLGFTRLALHASSLSLTLPHDGRRTFEAPLPADFSKL